MCKREACSKHGDERCRGMREWNLEIVVNCSSWHPKCEGGTGTNSCKNRSEKKLRYNVPLSMMDVIHTHTLCYSRVYWLQHGIITAYIILAARQRKSIDFSNGKDINRKTETISSMDKLAGKPKSETDTICRCLRKLKSTSLETYHPYNYSPKWKQLQKWNACITSSFEMCIIKSRAYKIPNTDEHLGFFPKNGM